MYIAETDHILLRPLPNLASRTVPAAFNFGYMVAWGQAKVVDKFVPGLGGKTDPVGPSPVIIHVEQLKQVRAEAQCGGNAVACAMAMGWVGGVLGRLRPSWQSPWVSRG